VKNFVDLLSLSLHRAVAKKMRLNSHEVIRVARENIDRWLNGENFIDHGRRALLEWRYILEHSTPEEIERIISADTDESQRLRSSSPFVGVLTEAERMELFDACAKITAI
jgi:hypothetical protein